MRLAGFGPMDQRNFVVAAAKHVLGVVEGRAAKPLGSRHAVGALDFHRRVSEVDAGEIGVEGPEVGAVFDGPAVEGGVVSEALTGVGLGGVPETGHGAAGLPGLAGLPERRVGGVQRGAPALKRAGVARVRVFSKKLLTCRRVHFGQERDRLSRKGDPAARREQAGPMRRFGQGGGWDWVGADRARGGGGASGGALATCRD